MSLETEINRLHWQSRRGMWELDLLLVPFIKNHYAELDQDDRKRYEDLLACEDQDLFVWLMRRELPEHPEHRIIVEKIIEYAENSDLDHFKSL
ncbi:antitoxin CptB [Oceanospirillum multiglobuliferum]|uniref:FAD assembly factor SdhE n=1 Tax=Oceanospirillum multiglobuliferum TaxID=64969 RepID=A0A1T4KML3_9GAMM|nr:succinate dehydrogenase assembly factor 2 [Oceanospirillum multiglobuliferum]OPX56074.1 succinate dehydrogenase assembly factor 2 [Oceanospirillum multiglobuliferum]SJZ43627.1 antitoxin CptB [Oceanospirillum multiglobuliferum]